MQSCAPTRPRPDGCAASAMRGNSGRGVIGKPHPMAVELLAPNIRIIRLMRRHEDHCKWLAAPSSAEYAGKRNIFRVRLVEKHVYRSSVQKSLRRRRRTKGSLVRDAFVLLEPGGQHLQPTVQGRS